MLCDAMRCDGLSYDGPLQYISSNPSCQSSSHSSSIARLYGIVSIITAAIRTWCLFSLLNWPWQPVSMMRLSLCNVSVTFHVNVNDRFYRAANQSSGSSSSSPSSSFSSRSSTGCSPSSLDILGWSLPELRQCKAVYTNNWSRIDWCYTRFDYWIFLE